MIEKKLSVIQDSKKFLPFSYFYYFFHQKEKKEAGQEHKLKISIDTFKL